MVIFEGRDAAGKGGVIKRITQRLNPRICRIAELPAPNERERTQWYFQRYDSHLPAGGEIVLFDRSWCNRAGVERVMSFCTDEDVEEFMRTVPEFERMLVRSGIVLIKYWFSITDDEQHFRFMMRVHDPLKQWKLSPMDLEARRRWQAYTKAKEAMLERTSIPEAPWWIVEADDKKRARLNCIQHLLISIPYQEVSTIRSCCRPVCTTRTTCGLRCRRKCTSRQSISDRSAAFSALLPGALRSSERYSKKFCGPWNRGLRGGFSRHGHAPRPSPPPNPPRGAGLQRRHLSPPGDGCLLFFTCRDDHAAMCSLPHT